MKRFIVLILLTITLSSHELFLKTNHYTLQPNQESELYLFNGTFDQSENEITRDRITKAVILGPDFMFRPEESDYRDQDQATYMKFRTGEAGTYIAGISTLPRVLEMNAQDFREYLEHEGLEDLIKERDRQGISANGAREKYSKHVKTILQVGDSFSDHCSKELGYPIEFIALDNPYKLSAGDQIRFRLLRNRKPLPNQVVHFSSRKAGETEGKENSLRTNKKGEIEFKVDRSGQWYIASIHIEKSSEKEVDYESNWATLTFEIR